jgi:protein-tyrosine phosphatase
VRYLRRAIPDMGVPSPAGMRATLDAIYEAIGAGDPLYVHCWGGIGRTGTVVGCLLREQGFTVTEALDLIARKWRVMEKRNRHPNSPETPGQVTYIRRWE